MHRSESRPASPSTSPTPAVLGSEAATKTPTDSCANTSPRAPTSRVGTLKRLKRLQPCSTADPARPLIGRHLLKHSTSIYYWSNKPVLRQSIEPSQYLAIRYTERLADEQAVTSVGSKGDSFDNALAETVNGLYKTELIYRRGPWKSMEQLELATGAWVNWWNEQRLHEACQYVPPAEFEGNYYRRLGEPSSAA
jgi:hypothetical protein